MKKTADPYAQSVGIMRYIARNYGSPAAAYGAWLGRSPHWYGEGGIFRRPAIIGVGERGPEAVVPLSRGAVTAEEIGQAVAQALREQPPIVSVRALQAADARYGRGLGSRR